MWNYEVRHTKVKKDSTLSECWIFRFICISQHPLLFHIKVKGQFLISSKYRLAPMVNYKLCCWGYELIMIRHLWCQEHDLPLVEKGESEDTISKQSLCHHSLFWRQFVTYANFLLTKFSKNTWYLLINMHMKHINVLDFDDKSDRNCCFSFGNFGIIFNGASAQPFLPGRMGNSAGSDVTHQPTTAEINRCRVSEDREEEGHKRERRESTFTPPCHTENISKNNCPWF